MIITDLWQYPVKGLGGVTIAEAELQAGQHFPGDRMFAITNGHPRNADMPPGQWRKKTLFLQLMSNERLAALECEFSGTRLVIREGGTVRLEADLDTSEGGAAASAFFTAFCDSAIAGRARLTRISSGAFTDTQAPWISLGGTASVAHAAASFGHRPDARRYRLNIMLETTAPFEEAKLVGHLVSLGDAVLRIVEPVGRCAAIDVDPENGVRGRHLLPMMDQAFGHTDLGIFAEVVEGGTIRPGDGLHRLD